jgi:hypothetical protein
MKESTITGCMVRVGKTHIVYRILVDMPLEKWSFGRTRVREDSSDIHSVELCGTCLGLWLVLVFGINCGSEKLISLFIKKFFKWRNVTVPVSFNLLRRIHTWF